MTQRVRRPARIPRLQRLREAVANHNWLGVVIEILIVTVGILLAFQIEQWGEEQQRAKEERQFLERLFGEYGRAVEEMREVISHHDRIMTDFRKAFAAKDDPTRLRDYATHLNFGCRAGYLGTAPFSDTASQELLSSGKLNTISDAGLRAKIRDLTTAQAWLKDRASAAREVTRDAGLDLNRHYRYEILPDGKSICRVRWTELFADPMAVTAAVRTYRMHELVGGGRRDLMRMTQQVRKDIACSLDKPECRT